MDWNAQGRDCASRPDPAYSGTPRLFPLDALRGLIIILMALDHANHFIAQQHPPGEYWGGPFPAYYDALTFFTRLVTHLAAPGFFLLMGMSMVLFAAARRKSGWGKAKISLHLSMRGLILIALQILVVNRAWELSSGGWALNAYVGVLFALGAAMMLGSLVVWLKPGVLLVLTVGLVLVTALLVPNPGQWGQSYPVLARLILVPGGTTELWVNYPVLPWLGLVTFGLAFGNWLLVDRRQAYDLALKLAVAFLIAFFVLRLLDGFGNIRPRPGDTWIDFLNVVKYPPSITFLLLTTGTNLLLLGLLARAGEGLQKVFQPLLVFGRVPLFFYLAHLFLYAGLGLLLTPQGSNWPTMLLCWLLGLLILYPLCLWYGRFKRQRPTGSIWRFC